MLHFLTHILPIVKPTENRASIQTADFKWDVYQFDTTIQGYPLSFDIALAEPDASVVMVALMTLKDEFPELHKAAFKPIVEALKPVVISQRDKATMQDLQAAGYPDPGPVNNAYFAPLGSSATAKNRL